jgi:ABC-type polysaccharide/polyol phosphate transport system ATPase subunit
MTILPTKVIKNNYNMQTHKAIQLETISKKYPLMKQMDKNIKINFEDFWALKDVSLDVYNGEILGIIGRNGAGKTTLLNIIAGVLSQTQGKICVNGKVLGLFNLGVGFQDELTGRENIFLNGAILGAPKSELEDKLSSIIEFSELGNFIDMPLGTYSQGMRLRLGFSIIVNLGFDILLIDEVLAVGDALFQSKCFERLMDFKRIGKTLVITNQSMDFIERLCDRVALLDHGQLLFQGNTVEGVNKYRTLLNTEKFFVGPIQKNTGLVENTKRWADDKSNWGNVLGTKEVIIKRVEFINRFGWECPKIRSGNRLKIKVHFTARNSVKDPHFGVAIFRNDGVYCYGPNTKFEEYKIPELKQGNSYFVLDYHKLLLAPGEYRVSVAIWDKFETLAFSYHEGYYKLTVIGNYNKTNELLNMPFKSFARNYKDFQRDSLDLSLLSDKWEKKIETGILKIESVKLLNNLGEEKATFMTNEPVTLIINFSKLINGDKNFYLWVGIYRDDGVYCQGISQPLSRNSVFKVLFPRLPLLPGGYRLSVGIWDSSQQKFILCHHAVYPFRMVFNKADHGTIYLEHSWYGDNL